MRTLLALSVLLLAACNTASDLPPPSNPTVLAPSDQSAEEAEAPEPTIALEPSAIEPSAGDDTSVGRCEGLPGVRSYSMGTRFPLVMSTFHVRCPPGPIEVRKISLHGTECGVDSITYRREGESSIATIGTDASLRLHARAPNPVQVELVYNGQVQTVTCEIRTPERRPAL